MIEIGRSRSARLVLAALFAVLLASCGSSSPSGTVEQFCEAVQQFEEETNELFFGDSTSDPVESFASIAGLVRKAADAAPEEIRDSAEHNAAAFAALEDALRERAPQTLAEFSEIIEELAIGVEAEFGDLDEVSDRLEDFATERCQVDVEGQ